MSADQIANTLADVMNQHEMDFTYDGKQTGCSCGRWQDRGPISAEADHHAHLANVIAPLIEAREQEAAKVALQDAADDAEETIRCGDIAEIAAHVEGEVGRAAAVSARDQLYEEPVAWLRARAGDGA